MNGIEEEPSGPSLARVETAEGGEDPRSPTSWSIIEGEQSVSFDGRGVRRDREDRTTSPYGSRGDPVFFTPHGCFYLPFVVFLALQKSSFQG
jgi:hypothetical protein